jgi:hypothetical protein
MPHGKKRDHGDKPDTSLEEVLHEIEEAGTHPTDSDRRRGRRGEAGDAITPNQRAQEESRHD